MFTFLVDSRHDVICAMQKRYESFIVYMNAPYIHGDFLKKICGSKETLMRLRSCFNLNCSCLQVKLICSVHFYSDSSMKYNEITFRIFPRKEEHCNGKDFRRTFLTINFRGKSIHLSTKFITYKNG